MFAAGPWSSRTFRSAVSAAFIGIVGALALIAAALIEERANRVGAATAQVDNTSRLIASYVLQTIEKVDMVVLDVQDHIIPEDMRARRGRNPRRDDELHRLLARKLAAIPEGSALHVTNAHGELLYSSMAPVPNVNISDRHHFLVHKENRAAGLLISPPLMSRSTGKWALIASRRLDFEDGSFAGILNLVVNLDGMEKFFATVDVMQHGVVNMRDGEMRLVARFPTAQLAIGDPVPDHPALPFLRQGLTHAIYEARGSVDMVMRLYSFRAVGDHGFYVFVGLSAEDYLADWRLHVGVYGLSGLVLSVAMLLMVWFARRSVIEQERAQEALVREEEKFHTIADHTYDWEYWQGADGEILFMSPSCERITGYSPAEFVSDPALLLRIIHPDDEAPMAQHAASERYADEGTIDFRIVRRDGAIRWIAHGCRAVFGHDGKFMGRRVSNLDITDRKDAQDKVHRLNAELEDRVARRTAELEAANKELEEFSYSVSHDMRAPLRAIDGFAGIVLDECGEALGEAGRRRLADVRSNAHQMARLIDDILHFLHLRRHKMAPARLDIAAMARDAFDEFTAALPAERRGRLAVGEMAPAWGDHEMIREVVRNLISNAVKFSAPEREPLIEVGGAVDADGNAYYVKDNGVGFDMRFADKLFKVFERVHPTGQYEGTAIGLALVKRIVERHGGRVRAEGKVGEGASFHFSLPAPGHIPTKEGT